MGFMKPKMQAAPVAPIAEEAPVAEEVDVTNANDKVDMNKRRRYKLSDTTLAVTPTLSGRGVGTNGATPLKRTLG